MDYASLLNESQYKAVSTSAQYVRIVAGAGSGKTRVLTYRISYLISECHVDPRRILAIAFTNKVANEMKERAQKLVGENSPSLHVMTFHSFCARFLREEAYQLGYPVGFTIFDEDDQASLVKDICVGLGYKKGDRTIKDALAFIRHNKTKGIYPDDVTNKNNLVDVSESLKIYRLYEEKKTQMLCFDFDDLLLKVIYILENSLETRKKWANRFDHILVDEFQDTNDVQYHLMKLLSRSDTCLYVVGDPDQTIYTWRGANQEIILDFALHFQNAETIILDRNYRSTEAILNAANALIEKNKKRVKKNLYTKEGAGEPISAYKAYSSEEEAKWVLDQIEKIKRNQFGNVSNIAILYRASYLTRPFESEFARRGINYRIFGGLRFYQRMEVKDVLAYFRLLRNSLDDVSFDRVVNVPRRGIGPTTLERIKLEAKQAGKSEYDYLKTLDPNQSEISPKARNALNMMIQTIEDTKAKIDGETGEAYSSILKDFINKLNYFEYLKEDESPNEDRAANVNALFADIDSYISHNPESNFDQYLQNISLLTSQDDMNDGNYVSLSTIHIAKGLEFDYVFVIGLNEGTFPSERSMLESGKEAEEEERRLAYVAFTRAKKKLYVSCNSSYSYVTDGNSMPSRFFEEAGIKLPNKQSTFDGSKGFHRTFKKTTSYDSFFSDGPAISPFEDDSKSPDISEKPKTNGVLDWKVGDNVHHEKFGDGVVTAVISTSIIQIQFANEGKKTLMANHPSLSKISSKGGQA